MPTSLTIRMSPHPQHMTIKLVGLPGWERWRFMIDVDRHTGRVLPDGMREIAPADGPGRRKNARTPLRDRRTKESLMRIAESWFCDQGGDRGGADPLAGSDAVMNLLAAARPSPHGTHKTAERAQTIALMYETALDLGLCPRRAISAVYGLPVEDTDRYPKFSSTLHRWIKEARTIPSEEAPYLRRYERERDTPRRWPVPTRRPMAPRRTG